jgi:hypothetical protein
VRALSCDLTRCVTTTGGNLEVDDAGVRTVSYLDGGSAGIALVIDELLDHREDDRLMANLPLLLKACVGEIVVQATLFNGRSGLIAALSRAGGRTMADFRPAVARHLHRLALHAVAYRGELAYPGEHSLRLSMDVATGSAGVLLAIHAATATTSTFLPFLSPRLGWCGHGGGPPPPEPISISPRRLTLAH